MTRGFLFAAAVGLVLVGGVLLFWYVVSHVSGG